MDLTQAGEIASGDGEDALAQLLDNYRPYLLAIANATLHRDVQAKMAPSDIVQITIMSAHGRFPEFNGSSETSLRNWLRRILKNQVVDQSRAFHSEKRNIQREVPTDLHGEKAACCSETPVSIALRVEQGERLRREIDSLPEPECRVVKLYHEEGLSFTQIADELNCSRETARRCWGRALTMLATAFGDDSC